MSNETRDTYVDFLAAPDDEPTKPHHEVPALPPGFDAPIPPAVGGDLRSALESIQQARRDILRATERIDRGTEEVLKAVGRLNRRIEALEEDVRQNTLARKYLQARGLLPDPIPDIQAEQVSAGAE